jgi:hypothetical protein
LLSGKFQNLPTIAGGILVFLAALSLYLATIAPTLSWGRDRMGVDGGDLLAAVETLGIPHPSGYPTYVIALKDEVSQGFQLLQGDLRRQRPSDLDPMTMSEQ